MRTDVRRRWRFRRFGIRRTVAFSLVLVLLIFGVATDRLFIRPVLDPPPPRVDAIVELGGEGMEGRDHRAIGLARAHRAPFLVQSTVVEEAGTNRCLSPGTDVTVLCFHADPNTTRGEARYIAEEAERRHWKSIILVTTPDQAWRARLRVTRCFGGEVYLATSPLPQGLWLRQVTYQWAATMKALIFERAC